MNPASTADRQIPPDLVYALPSIVEPLALEQLFPISQPLEVELGSGDGSFLLAYANDHPDRNFIGVERLLGRIRKLDRKGRRMHLANLRGVRIECAYFLRYLLPQACVEAMHVYFPDPWPKKKHQRHRLVNDRFPLLAARVLKPAGTVFLRTDDPDYFQQMTTVFSGAPRFAPIETPRELAARTTDFERDFLEAGKPTHRSAFRLQG